MDAQTQMLIEKRQALQSEVGAMESKAHDGQRGLSPNESHRKGEISVELRDLNEQIEKRQVEEASNAQASTALRELADKPVEKRSGYTGATETRWLAPSINHQLTEKRDIGTNNALVPIEYSTRWFDALRPYVGVLDSGPEIIRVDHAGSIKIPVVTADVTVGGVAEGVSISESDPAFSNITLDPKKFAAFTRVDREAIEDSSPQVLDLVESTMLEAFAVQLDAELVAGGGTGQDLLGLLGITGFTPGPSTGANGASLSGSAGLDFLFDTMGAAESANLNQDRLGWLMNSRTWQSIRKLKDSQGRPIVSVDMAVGASRSLLGRPVRISNNISSTLTAGTSTDTSSLLLVDWSKIVVAVSRQVELAMSPHVSFQSDQIALRVTGRFDIGAPKPQAIVKTSGLRP